MKAQTRFTVNLLKLGILLEQGEVLENKEETLAWQHSVGVTKYCH